MFLVACHQICIILRQSNFIKYNILRIREILRTMNTLSIDSTFQYSIDDSINCF